MTRPDLDRRSQARLTFSLSLSRAEVASSSNRMAGSLMMALAIAILCTVASIGGIRFRAFAVSARAWERNEI